MSIGGEDPATLTSPSKITFGVGRKGAGSGTDLSPRSQARRKAVCPFLSICTGVRLNVVGPEEIYPQVNLRSSALSDRSD